MIINHNMGALNANRQMGINQTNANKSMEKLSSGLKINRAGDDAAGLAISEKMRAQIRGLDQASANAQDGISLIQTAEGALSETHNILQRMRELSVQSANDTNIAEDRAAIQEEMNALTQEIDRISEQTQFNKQTLLDGTFNGTFQIGANGSQTINLGIDAMDSSNLNLISNSNKVETGTFAKAEGTSDTKTVADGEYSIKGDKVLDSAGKEVGTIDTDKKVITFTDTKGKGGTPKDAKLTFTTALSEGGKFKISGDTATAGTQEVKNDLVGTAKELAAGNYEISGTKVLKDGKEIGKVNSGDIVIGNKTIKAADLTSSKLSTADGTKFTINGTDVSSSLKASGSIETINKAIEQVSTQRAKLGAVQNRLEHTTANLENTSENLTAAESRIRDVNMAKEMSTFSKNNILSQAAQAMLAQANNQPQQVLQLLR